MAAPAKLGERCERHNWIAINDGLTNTLIRALVLDPVAPTTVYAATVGGGVFVLRQ